MEKSVFYRDESNKFKVNLKIEGASINKSKARLLLNFENVSLMFTGTLYKNGVCEIAIPPLKMIDENEGKAVLEVIADSSFFEPWKSDFIIKNRKVVKVERAEINPERDNKIKVEVLNESRLFNENCPINYIKIVGSIFEHFKKLSKDERKECKRTLTNYKPKKKIYDWAKKVFSNPDRGFSKYCMYEIEKFIDKDKE